MAEDFFCPDCKCLVGTIFPELGTVITEGTHYWCPASNTCEKCVEFFKKIGKIPKL